jgi:hypothetical protein
LGYLSFPLLDLLCRISKSPARRPFIFRVFCLLDKLTYIILASSTPAVPEVKITITSTFTRRKRPAVVVKLTSAPTIHFSRGFTFSKVQFGLSSLF